MSKHVNAVTALLVSLSALVAACGGTGLVTSTPARSVAVSLPSTPTAPPVTVTELPATVAPSPSAAASPITGLPSHGCADAGLTLGTDPSAELAPGDYTVGNPPMDFTIPEPTDDVRWFGAAECAGGFVIRRANDPCDGCEDGQIAVIVTPESVDLAVAEWTTAAGSYLSGVEPAELGGATGVRFEGVLPTEQNVVFVHGGFNPHGYVAVYVLAVGTEAVVVVINQYEQPKSFVDDARPVVESFRFDV